MEVKYDATLITVLMAEYNTVPQLLRGAISSILAQTERRFELIVVDDGTENDLVQLASEFEDERIRVIGYGENRGFVAALNYGLAAARGEFVARMDTDDIADPSYLAETLVFLREHPEFDVVSGQALEFSADGPSLVQGVPGEVTRKSLMRGGAPIHAASMIRKRALLAVQGYPDYRRAEDLALWCELLLTDVRMYILPKVLYQYRVNEADFAKRRFKHRGDEIRVRLHYYPKLGGGPREYFRVAKTVLSGILPVPLVRWIRSRIHVRAS